MATLSETAYYSRNFIKYGSITIVALLILRVVFGAFSAWWKATYPPPPPPPTVAFGKLPPTLPSSEKPDVSFQLETATGGFEEYGDRAYVYIMPAKRGNLLALERAKALAKRMDFIGESEIVPGTGTLYRWTKSDPFPSVLEIDTTTGHFLLNGNWRTRPQLLAETSTPSVPESIAVIRSWLSSIDLLADDLSIGPAEVGYLKVSGTELIPALSQSEAQFVRVDLFRASLEKAPVLPTDPERGIVSITFFNTKRYKQQLIEAEYKYYPVDYEQKATYPIITAAEAWSKFLEGDAHYASIEDNLTEIPIREIELGYYDPPTTGGFLQPIFIFKGDGGFIGYVEAIQSEWIQPSGD